jgi:hypothetical protein
MTALFILDVAGHRGLVSYIDAGIVTYEITDVNSVLVFWNVLSCLKIFNWAFIKLEF